MQSSWPAPPSKTPICVGCALKRQSQVVLGGKSTGAGGGTGAGVAGMPPGHHAGLTP